MKYSIVCLQALLAYISCSFLLSSFCSMYLSWICSSKFSISLLFPAWLRLEDCLLIFFYFSYSSRIAFSQLSKKFLSIFMYCSYLSMSFWLKPDCCLKSTFLSIRNPCNLYDSNFLSSFFCKLTYRLLSLLVFIDPLFYWF